MSWDGLTCGSCGEPIVQTDAGWTHANSYGQLLKWTCADPHLMRLAEPIPPAPPILTPGPPTAQSQQSAPLADAEPPPPHRRVTPIPPATHTRRPSPTKPQGDSERWWEAQ